MYTSFMKDKNSVEQHFHENIWFLADKTTWVKSGKINSFVNYSD